MVKLNVWRINLSSESSFQQKYMYKWFTLEKKWINYKHELFFTTFKIFLKAMQWLQCKVFPFFRYQLLDINFRSPAYLSRKKSKQCRMFYQHCFLLPKHDGSTNEEKTIKTEHKKIKISEQPCKFFLYYRQLDGNWSKSST